MPVATTRYTIDEAIGILERSTLSTVVVEGGDDAEILRNIEEKLKGTVPDIDFFDVGNKDTVLKIWERRLEIGDARVQFLADSDLWLFNDNRMNYPGVIFTEGYSIENSCLESPAIMELMAARSGTAVLWEQALESLALWFSAEVAYANRGEDFRINRGIDGLLLVSNACALSEICRERVKGLEKTELEAVYSQIRDDPLKFVIGKVLVLALKAVLEAAEGLPASKQLILAIGSKTKNPSLEHLTTRISEAFASLPNSL